MTTVDEKIAALEHKSRDAGFHWGMGGTLVFVLVIATLDAKVDGGKITGKAFAVASVLGFGSFSRRFDVVYPQSQQTKNPG